MKKRIAVLLCLTCFCLFCLAGCGKGNGGSGDNGVVRVYNWGEYIDEELIDQFEEETGIRVIYDTFETNEEMYPIVEAGGASYDVVCPSDYMIEKMIQNGLVQKIDMSSM